MLSYFFTVQNYCEKAMEWVKNASKRVDFQVKVLKMGVLVRLNSFI